jgi:anaerobic dimethyl sulfoxide reductase subunit A
LGHFLNTVAKYSDIVLPITTLWERDDTSNMLMMSQRELAVFPAKVVEPQYEAKDDIWVAQELSTRLGLNAAELYPFTGAQARYNMFASELTFISPDGIGPLFTISQEDIDEIGAQGQPQEGMFPLAEIKEKGYVQIPRAEGDYFGAIGWGRFVADPEGSPLPSKSGKLELYCEEWANLVNMQGRSTIKPYPTYIKPLNGYEDSFSNWETKTKGEYPYQITNPHYLRRSHTTIDNVSWLREAMPNPVWLNTEDAKEKGVSEGDTVLLYNQYGKTLRTATLTERMMPGVISLPHGSWVDLDEETGIDRGGADNILCAPRATGAGTSGYNTNLVNFEKYTGDALDPDYTWPQRIVEL